MLTRLILKVSILAAFATFVYCLLTNVSLQSCATRALIVFSGFYAVLIAFLLTLRLVFDPEKKSEQETLTPAEAEESPAESTEVEVAELESVPETIGAVSEQ